MEGWPSVRSRTKIAYGEDKSEETEPKGEDVHALMSTRGPFIVCDSCLALLKEENKIDERGRAVSDSVSDEFCVNCYDRNKILIDDLAGSTE